MIASIKKKIYEETAQSSPNNRIVKEKKHYITVSSLLKQETLSSSCLFFWVWLPIDSMTFFEFKKEKGHSGRAQVSSSYSFFFFHMSVYHLLRAHLHSLPFTLWIIIFLYNILSPLCVSWYRLRVSKGRRRRKKLLLERLLRLLFLAAAAKSSTLSFFLFVGLFKFFFVVVVCCCLLDCCVFPPYFFYYSLLKFLASWADDLFPLEKQNQKKRKKERRLERFPSIIILLPTLIYRVDDRGPPAIPDCRRIIIISHAVV